MSIEIELRYEVIDPEKISHFIQPMCFLQTKHIVDVYLDTIDGDLRKRGIFVRVRNNTKIDIKFNRACLGDNALEIQPYCQDYSFVLPIDASNEVSKFNTINHELGLKTSANFDFEHYKKANNLIEHRIVDKIRSSYQTQDFIIVVDEVKHLGTFLEIEMMAQDNHEIDKTVERMHKILAGLPLKSLKTGYDSLILRKQNFEQYLQGRFILDEDKKFRLEQI